jgi:hypothetical protein
LILSLLLFVFSAATAHAQVERAYRDKLLTVDAGAFGSVFKTNLPDSWGSSTLGGIGAVVDVNLTPWLGIESEARWLRFHQTYDVHEDNYLIGARYRPLRYGRHSLWVKGLFGAGELNFPHSYAHGGYTDIVFGGHYEYRMTKHVILRPIDVEYQMWPYLLGGTINPLGISFGVKYRVY